MKNLDIIKSFKQGKVKLETNSSTGNCASIALIKASIEIFGLNLFELSKEEDTYTAILKDGSIVKFTDNELNRSNNVIDFIPNENKTFQYMEIYKYAQLCMCIMTKKVMELGEAGKQVNNFEEALFALNDGAHTPTLPEKLGVQNFCSNPKLFVSSKKKCMIAWLKGHTVYMSHGYYDFYGKPIKVKSLFNKYIKRMVISN